MSARSTMTNIVSESVLRESFRRLAEKEIDNVDVDHRDGEVSFVFSREDGKCISVNLNEIDTLRVAASVMYAVGEREAGKRLFDRLSGAGRGAK